MTRHMKTVTIVERLSTLQKRQVLGHIAYDEEYPTMAQDRNAAEQHARSEAKAGAAFALDCDVSDIGIVMFDVLLDEVWDDGNAEE